MPLTTDESYRAAIEDVLSVYNMGVYRW